MELDLDNDNELMVAGIMLIIPIYMLYAAFMNEGQAQARLAAVIAGLFLCGSFCAQSLGSKSHMQQQITRLSSPDKSFHLLCSGDDCSDWRTRLEYWG